MSEKRDLDVIALKMAEKAIRLTSLKMRKATIQFLWDKYVVNAKPEVKEKKDE